MQQGHEEKYYQTLDQRFLGDERFVAAVRQRSEAKEIEIKGSNASFARLLDAICTTRRELNGTGADVLVGNFMRSALTIAQAQVRKTYTF